MRGILLKEGGGEGRTGITPAHAGNTAYDYLRDAVDEDHPRACGEYELYEDALPDERGSPPRMRGIPDSRPVGIQNAGITPAHAGNTEPVEKLPCG